jgi:UDP-N-acetylmuramyl tripeptide synthase
MKFRHWTIIIPAAIIVRLVYWVSRMLKMGEGSNFPGKVVLTVFPNLLKSIVPRFQNGWILITGTNGKTTTTKITVELLSRYGFKVVTNARGANLISGILTSILVDKLYPTRPFMADYAVFEIDEAVLTKSFHLVHPRILVVTNFSRDQLDRYGEVDTNVNKIMELLQNADYPCKVVLNGNDPNIARIGSVVAMENRLYFGIKEEIASAETGLLIEKEIGKGLEKGVEVPELDIWADAIQANYLKGSRFSLGFRQIQIQVHQKLPGIFNILNTLAAAGVCAIVADQSLTKLPGVLSTMEPSYGRSERFNYQGAPVYLFLVKNPVGFNHIIQLLTQASENKRILLLLNDLTADGKDVSWIWDIAMENMWKVSGIKEIVSSGTRAGDMALRIKYSNPPAIPQTTDYSPKRAFKELAARLQEKEDLLILANYTAMIKFRPYLLMVCRKSAL